MSALKDISGKRFGRLIVIEREGTNKHDKTLWLCQCDCGNTKQILSNSLLSRRTTSCGCYGRSFRGKNSPVYKTGSRRHPEYQSWLAMKTRCLNKNYHQYKDYGGRGITICERWLGDKGFDNFLKDLGQKPTVRHSLDRINVNGNYYPENCKWATYAEQARNRQNNYIQRGFYQSVKPKVNYRLFRERLGNGWTFSQAAFTPWHQRQLRADLKEL